MTTREADMSYPLRHALAGRYSRYSALFGIWVEVLNGMTAMAWDHLVSPLPEHEHERPPLLPAFAPSISQTAL